MNTPTKGTVLNVVSLTVACLALLLSFGNSIRTHYRNQESARAFAELSKKRDDLHEFIREVSTPSLVAMEKEHAKTAARLEEVIRAANEELTEVRKAHAAQKTAMKSFMDIYADDRKEYHKARTEDMRHNHEARMTMRREIMQELMIHMTTSHR